MKDSHPAVVAPEAAPTGGAVGANNAGTAGSSVNAYILGQAASQSQSQSVQCGAYNSAPCFREEIFIASLKRNCIESHTSCLLGVATTASMASMGRYASD